MPQNNVIRSSLLGNPGAQVRSESPIQPEPASLSAPSNVRNATQNLGSADAALESYNTPLNWIAISRCLTMHYADKRDLSTLEYQMTCLIQGKKTIQEFYGEVYSHLTLILNKIACMEINEEAMQVLTNTYRDKALDTFIRGLSGDLSRLLGMKEPADLPEALHLCIKLENQNYRAVHANNQYSLSKKPYPSPAAFQHFQNLLYPKKSSSEGPTLLQLAYLPQTISRMRQFNPQFPQQPQYFNPQIWPNRQIENHHLETLHQDRRNQNHPHQWISINHNKQGTSYPYPMALKSEVEKQINKLLEDGIIRPSRSPYNSPVWIVDKKPDSLGNKQYRHLIAEPEYTEDLLVNLLKRYLNPSVTNAIITEDHILGKIQTIYPLHFNQYKIRYTRKTVKDLTEPSQQESAIIVEHNRAHRSASENKAQLLEKFYFPQMNAKIKKITKQCKICQENKYERHPPNPILKATPIPTYPGQIVHIDIYHTNNKICLTAIDKFSKYAQVKLIKSRATQDLKQPLQELLTAFGIPEKIVIDNEKSLNSASIIFILLTCMAYAEVQIHDYSSSHLITIDNGYSKIKDGTLNFIHVIDTLAYRNLLENITDVMNSTLPPGNPMFPILQHEVQQTIELLEIVEPYNIPNLKDP
ncbi:Retrovirus-related Gag polyprotein from transposon HMS-Beagle [Eumeta japonica]|uniref:RNA-directed DNA polymerase n=1 Tax=Eumeta variegata TaxID=151549 RepID=A0A4C1TAD7_EUMVA|nr:Retrovirus-related Gag polyprotein from transposon HMS-Beagle [Eumeta japonica]